MRDQSMYSPLAVGLLAAAGILAGCGDSSSTDPELVFGNLGLICIGPDVEAGQAKLLNSINTAAASEGLTQVSMESSGSPELSRTSYGFEDNAGKSVRLDFIDRAGADLRVLITADENLRASFTDAVWAALAPQLK